MSNYNIIASEFEGLDIRVAFTNDDGTIVDLTGFDAFLSLEGEDENGDAQTVEFSSITGQLSITPLEGAIDIVLSPAEVSATNLIDIRYHLYVSQAGTPPDTIMRGFFVREL